MVKADFQGSMMGGTNNFVYCKVEKSKNPLLLGVEGICVQETKDTFKIVTKQNEFKGGRNLSLLLVLPKQGSIFHIEFDGRKILLYGNRLRQRQSIRAKANKKPGKGDTSIEL